MKLQLAHGRAENDYARQPADRLHAVRLDGVSRVALLTEREKHEVLDFLKIRPVHTVIMRSFIADNGFESEFNRGRFYGYRNASGALEGVALIGHSTLVEAHSEAALTSLAHKAREAATPIHLMMSGGDSIESFWRYYSGTASAPRLVCLELLFEIKHPLLVREPVPGMRQARAEDLLPIAEAHAAVAIAESGADPLDRDPEGFLRRVLRRIDQGRIWVVFENGELVFKADVVAETPEVMYLEGIYVNPARRGRGLGTVCLSQLSRTLLDRVRYLCLLSNINFHQAHRAYLKAGFKSRDCCVTIFV